MAEKKTARLSVYEAGEQWVAAWNQKEARKIFEGWDVDFDGLWGEKSVLRKCSLDERIKFDPNLCGDNVPIPDDSDGVMDVSFRELIQWHASRGVKFPSVICVSSDHC